MGVLYTARIHWTANELLLDAKKYKVTVPTALKDEQVRTPSFVDVTVMNQKAREGAVGSKGGGLSIVNGLVTRELEVHFRNPATQWKRLSTSTMGPGQFQFQGGEIYLDLDLAIFVLDHLKPDPKDDISGKIFAEIYGHELLHVLDENDIAKNWLPPLLDGDKDISSLLTKPYTYGRSSDSITVVEKEFHEYIRKRIEGMIRNDHWAPQTNERAGRRDAPSEYAKVQDRVDTLRASRTIRR
ncbi:MAG: hypothetical protein ACRD3M_12710 [Thermoanaerobaculia bacterium]